MQRQLLMHSKKATFDKQVLLQKPGEVIFSKGQLVQIYRSDLDYTFKMECKLLPKWSIPQRITSRQLNSYMLETLKGDPIAGTFSAHQLQRFIPREGTKLAEEQVDVHNKGIAMKRGGHMEYALAHTPISSYLIISHHISSYLTISYHTSS